MHTDTRMRYLHRRGAVYWLKLAIPRELRPLYLTRNGKERTHVEESLDTTDLDRAHSLKFGRIDHWQREFGRNRRAASGALTPDVVAALENREALKQAANDDEIEILESLAVGRAEEIQQLTGSLDRAKEWYALATDIRRPTLRASFDEWERQSTRAAGTRIQYRHAFEELMRVLKLGGDAMPEAITMQRTKDYVRWLDTEALGPRGPLAFETKQVRIVALSSFWTDYLARNEYVPLGVNPWRGHKLTGRKQAHKGDETVRPHHEAELLRILNGPDIPANHRTLYPKRTLIELYALGEFVGCRLNELCSLTLGDVQRTPKGYTLHIRKSKSPAGMRSLPVTHAIPCAVLKERIGKRKDAEGQLFEEFKLGGVGKLSANVQKALGRYRDRVDIPPEVTFHSTRRDFISMLEARGANPLWIARYAGHTLPGVTFGVYAQVSPESLHKVAQRVHYPAKVEQAFRKALAIRLC